MPFPDTIGPLKAFTREEIEEMHHAALRVLEKLGIQVANVQAREALAEAGAKIEGDRAFFEPSFIEERLAAILSSREPGRARPMSEHLTIGIGDMCQYYHSPFSDEIELMSTADTIEATRCVETMRNVGIGSYVPGVPRDVPQQLQAIVEYRIGSEFLTGHPTLDTLHPPEALPYLLEMAEAMGRPLQSGGMFTVSPLRLAGYEFDIAVQYAAHWQRFWVTSYPGVGATAPVRMRAAWVLSIAECLGGAVTLHVIGGGKPVHFNIGMFPFDLRTLAVVGGMPECAWMYWCSAQVNRFYDPNASYSMMLGTQAKRPGLQAGYEKGLTGAFGVLTGCDDLHYAGVMSFDDIFSPEQMVADCELRDALERLRRNIPPEDPDRWLEEIGEGLRVGYVQADATLDHFRETYWFPKYLDRSTWHSFEASGGRTAREHAREEIIARLRGYYFNPPPEIEDLRRIFREAWDRLGGDPRAPFLEMMYNRS
jgi:trimethylamine--corrinoid protein Co-methyltransferase